MWDNNSGIRERLALLAELGPAMTPADWGYNPSRDYWYRCGGDARVKSVNVRQEGSASLAILLDKWHVERPTAMAAIGHPENGPNAIRDAMRQVTDDLLDSDLATHPGHGDTAQRPVCPNCGQYVNPGAGNLPTDCLNECHRRGFA